MSNDKWNDIWKIMKSGRLEFVDKCINDILCVICKEILINAYSGPCGCRYCLECITNYLNGEEKICPGNTYDCKDKLIIINKNLSIDQPMNRKLSKLLVKCPEKDCEFQDEVSNIENHMSICNFRSVECPYMAMGCKECNLVETDGKNHMLTEIVSHTKLIFKYVDNLKNEIEMLKEDKVRLEKNVNDIKNDYEEIKLRLIEIEKKHDEEQKENDDSKSKCENEQRKIEEKIKEIEKKFDERNRESVTKIDEINHVTADLKLLRNESDKSITTYMNEMIMFPKNQEQENCGGEFVWRIEEWKEKMEEVCIKSESFHSHKNGYKMSLWLWPNGWSHDFGLGTHISVSCCVIQGKCDDILPWPFKHDLTFELINQHTTKIHTSSTVRYGDRDEKSTDIYYNEYNQKPKGMNSVWICRNYKFVSLKELSNNPSLTDNNQIFIRCRVNINR